MSWLFFLMHAWHVWPQIDCKSMMVQRKTRIQTTKKYTIKIKWGNEITVKMVSLEWLITLKKYKKTGQKSFKITLAFFLDVKVCDLHTVSWLTNYMTADRMLRSNIKLEQSLATKRYNLSLSAAAGSPTSIGPPKLANRRSSYFGWRCGTVENQRPKSTVT